MKSHDIPFSKNKLTYNAIFQKHWSVFKYNVYFKHGFRYLKWQQNIENERLKAKALKKISTKTLPRKTN